MSALVLKQGVRTVMVSHAIFEAEVSVHYMEERKLMIVAAARGLPPFPRYASPNN